MKINELHIVAFGGLIDRDISLDDGLNIIEGGNESGKTSAAMFIKFIFYGLSGKSIGGALSERKRYVNFEKNAASGYLICTEGDVKYRVERSLHIPGEGESGVRETVRIVNLSDGSMISGGCPGEYFFGVGENIFVNTVFVGQLGGVRPDGEGLGGAVENMLSAADENVNLKKASERLNQARREIQHKNGGGGELASLTEERARLAEEVRDSSVSSEELIALEASLGDARTKQAQLEKKKEKLDGIFRALDIILVKKKVEAVAHTEEKIKKLRETVAKIDESAFLTHYSETLGNAERDIRTYRETQAAGAEQEPYDYETEGEELPPVVGSAEEVLEEASYLDTKSRIQSSVAIAMVIAAILGLVATVGLYYFNTGAYLLPLIIAGTCALLGVILFTVQHKTLNALYDILDEWDAQTVEDLEELLSSVPMAEPAPKADSYVSDLYAEAVSELAVKSQAGEAVIRSMAQGVGLQAEGDALVTAAAIRDYGEKLASDRENMIALAENFTGRLSVLREQIVNVDVEKALREAAEVAGTPYGKLAMSLDADGIKNAIRERDFTNGAYHSQSKRVEELERALADLKQHAKSPVEAAARIEEIDKEIRELTLKRDGYNLAVEALRQAGENMRSGVVPKLTAYASEIMAKAVDGRYSTLIPDAKFGMSYTDGAETRSVEHMSKGTYDAAYLSLRLATMRVVYKNAMPPLVLDESFAYIDETRFVNLLRCIADSGETDGVQSLFFTCRERETVEANRASLRYRLIQM